MKKSMLFVFVFLFMPMSFVCANEFHQGSLFKIKLVTERETVQCEYQFSETYHCEKNGNELDEKQSKNQLLLLFHHLNLHHEMKVEEMVRSLEEMGYEHVTFLDVRWIDPHQRLFTWIWEKDK
jgi:hypothetical protein